MNNHNDAQEERSATFAIDWLEYRGRVEWTTYQFNRWFAKLEEAKRNAQKTNFDEPIQIGEQIVLVAANGMGQGRQSRFEYRFTIGPVFFAVSGRDSQSVRHANLYVKLTGEACLLYGIDRCRKIVEAVVSELGGVVVEDSVSRIDVCLDVVGLCLNDGLQQACESDQMLGSLLKTQSNFASYGSPRTGMKVGSRKRVQLILYDKVVEVQKKGAAYIQGMMKHRWNDCIPNAATRIEYQIAGAWLRESKLVDVDTVIRQLPEIVEKLTATSNYPLFVVTESVPDRKNKNQKRCGIHPEWQWIVEQFRRLAGPLTEPLQRIERGKMQLNRAHSFIRGMITTVAAQMGMACESAFDGCNVLLALEEMVEPASDEWSRRWQEKAIRAGTLQDLLAFDFGNGSVTSKDGEDQA